MKRIFITNPFGNMKLNTWYEISTAVKYRMVYESIVNLSDYKRYGGHVCSIGRPTDLPGLINVNGHYGVYHYTKTPSCKHSGYRCISK